MAKTDMISKIISGILLIALLVLVSLILRPILLAILGGLLLAYIFLPVYKLLVKKIKNQTLSMVIILIVIVLLITIPTFYLAPHLAKQLFETYRSLQTVNFGDTINGLFPGLLNQETMATVSTQFRTSIATVFASLLSKFTRIIIDFPNILLQMTTLLFTFYFTLKKSDKLKEYAISFSPFSYPTTRRFINEFKDISNALVYGQFFIGLLQGLSVGVIVFILGISNPLLLTTVAVIAGIIPIIGPTVVWIPLAVYLLVEGVFLKAAILIVYSLIITSAIDPIIRPYILSKSSSNLPVFLALVGTIGGLYAFGLIGLIVGPLIMAYLMIVLDFYRQGKLSEVFGKN